jgi:hypothetical protein
MGTTCGIPPRKHSRHYPLSWPAEEWTEVGAINAPKWWTIRSATFHGNVRTALGKRAWTSDPCLLVTAKSLHWATPTENQFRTSTRQSAPLRTHWDRGAQTDGGFVRPDGAGSRSVFKSPVPGVPDFEFPLSSLGRLGWMKLTGEGKMLERWQRAPHLQILQVLGSDVDPNQAQIFFDSGFLYLATAHRFEVNLHFYHMDYISLRFTTDLWFMYLYNLILDITNISKCY